MACLHFRIDRVSRVCRDCGAQIGISLYGILDDGLARTGGPDDGYRGIPRTPVEPEEDIHALIAAAQAEQRGNSGDNGNGRTVLEECAPSIAGGPALGQVAVPAIGCPAISTGSGSCDLSHVQEDDVDDARVYADLLNGERAHLDPPLEATYEFIGGTAGTGKSFAAIQRATAYDDAILCATTGIAAVNLGGCTINSLLMYHDTQDLRVAYEVGRLGVFLRRLVNSGYYRILCDEVSMMDGHQLDILTLAIDDYNAWAQEQGKRQIGLTLTGDFAQLPPVNAPFVFERPSWARFAANTTILTEPHRQTDRVFLRALQAVRSGNRDEAMAYFGPRIVQGEEQHYDGSTILATNAEVDRYNKLRLLSLQTPEETFRAVRLGKQSTEWIKHIPDVLTLKPGALVMILANRRVSMADGGIDAPMIYANGDLGHYVRKIDERAAVVRLVRTGQEETVLGVLREKSKATGRLGRKVPRSEVEGSIAYMPLRVAYATTCHKCVAADTRVRTRQGCKPIEEVVAGQKIGGLSVRAVARAEQEAFHIHTRRGYQVIASGDHRWETKNGLVPTYDLLHERVALAIGASEFRVPAVEDDRLGWWLGATVGDGNYTDRREGQVHFASDDAYVRNRWIRDGRVLLGIPVAPRKDGRGAYLTSKPQRQQMEAWGLTYVKGPCKRIPQEVWRRERLWLPFLQGLFDTDGSVGRSRIVYATRSQMLGIEVQELLLLVGLVTTRREYPGVTGPYTQVTVSAEQLPLFKSIIGFRRPARAAQLALLKPNRVITHCDGYDEVVAVDPLGLTLPLIDVEVESPHVIGFGPLLGHNSQGLSLDRVQVMFHSKFWETPGMTYTALSRARTPEGLRLVGLPMQFQARITVNPKIVPWL